jgi:hypothetical protein
MEFTMMNSTEERKYKPLFRQALDPFLELLIHQKETYAVGNWMDQVERIRLRVTANPEQYLGKELPSPEIIKAIVVEIFDEHLKDSLDILNYKDLRTFRPHTGKLPFKN